MSLYTLTAGVLVMLSSAMVSLAVPVNTGGGDEVGFVPEPNRRGTIGILYSCLTTWTVCLWTARHADLHSYGYYILPKGKFKQLALYAVAPEVLAVSAVYQYSKVRADMKSARRLVQANSGPPLACSVTQAFSIKMGALHIVCPQGIFVDEKDTYVVLVLASEGFLELPTDQEIMDKSKSDSFSKTLACLQILWFALECAARTRQHLPLTLLELETAAYVFFGLVAFVAHWHKPRDVNVPLVRYLRPPSRIQNFDSLQQHVGRMEMAAYGDEEHLKSKEKRAFLRLVSLCLLGMAYGGWHCLAWRWPFPTVHDGQLWRICSLAIVPSIVGMALVFYCDEYLHLLGDRGPRWMHLCQVVYSMARVGIILECFLSLRELPSSAYDTVTWTAFIPHV